MVAQEGEADVLLIRRCSPTPAAAARPNRPVVHLWAPCSFHQFPTQTPGAVPHLKSQISNLKSQISNLKSQISNLKSQPSTLNPQPSTLNPQPSTLNPQPSTLNPQPSTLNPQPSTLNPQPSTLNPLKSQISNLKSQISTLNPQISTLNRSRVRGIMQASQATFLAQKSYVCRVAALRCYRTFAGSRHRNRSCASMAARRHPHDFDKLFLPNRRGERCLKSFRRVQAT